MPQKQITGATRAFQAFLTLSKVPWQWVAYVAIYALLFHWIGKFAPFEKEVVFGLLIASPAPWILEIVTLRPSIRRLLFSFSGRAPRSMYWMIWTAGFSAISVWGVGWAYIKFHQDMFLAELLEASLVLAMPLLPLWIIAVISVEVRRWHDLNHSGLFYLANLIPFAQVIIYPYLLFFRGTWGMNNYGDDPLSSKDEGSSQFGTIALFGIALMAFFLGFNVLAFRYILR